MGRGTPDRTVDESLGTPDVQTGQGDILTEDEHSALEHTVIDGGSAAG